MKFTQTKINGVWKIELEKKEDERGFFARSFCVDEFTKHGLSTAVAQCNISFNAKKGTLRGMHYQEEPKGEERLIRCTKGAIYDVAIDLRADSPTCKQHVAEELTQENYTMLFVPKGCAHGFQTLQDNTEVFYQMSQEYSPEHTRGVAYNDPAFGIAWPLPVSFISQKDLQYDFTK